MRLVFQNSHFSSEILDRFPPTFLKYYANSERYIRSKLRFTKEENKETKVRKQAPPLLLHSD